MDAAEDTTAARLPANTPELCRCQKSPITVAAGIVVLRTNTSKLMEQDQLVTRVSRFVHSQSNCSFTN